MIFQGGMGEGRTLFEDVAIARLTPLAVEYGLSLDVARSDLVRFASSIAYFEVYYDVRSMEVGIDIGLDDDSRLPGMPIIDDETWTIGRARRQGVTSLEAILKYYCSKESTKDLWGSFTFASPRDLDSGLSHLALSMRNCAGPFLTGDRAAFLAVEECSKIAAQALMHKMKIEGLRAKVSSAWLTKDYSTVFQTLNALGDDRTPAEDAKLEYVTKILTDR